MVKCNILKGKVDDSFVDHCRVCSRSCGLAGNFDRT